MGEVYNDVINFLGGSDAFFVKKLRKQYWKNYIYSYSSRPRPDYGFLLVTHGEIKISTADEYISAKAGDIIFIPKHLCYDAVIENEAEDYLINFDTNGSDVLFEKPYKLLENAPLYCIDRFLKLAKEQDEKGQRALRLRGLFYLLVDSIESAASEENLLKDRNMEKVKNILEDEKDYKISDIANECRMSESSLRKSFKAYYGISPAEYRLRYRLDRAKYLLESTNMTLGEISNALHFYDTAYFCRMFKVYSGMTPRAYAKTKSL